ncbi:T3SS effector HopA1 family protein [Nocardia sp. NPDC023852]|uniref:T3SS effector HopA1 family protein n=1 Tax=Nocardia sp. NPDC023852 TaxID=3154697 RepID=UPI00340412E0
MSYRENGVNPPDLSRESLDGFLRHIWDDQESIRDQRDVYHQYHASTEPNMVTNPRSYVRELAGVLDHRPHKFQNAFIQGGDPPVLNHRSARNINPDDIGFVHYGRASAVPDVNYRVYVNPRGDGAPTLMRGIVRDIVDDPSCFPSIHSAKIAGPRSMRSDGIVIYMKDMADVRRVVEWLGEYRQQHPDAFMWDVPAMTHQVMEGVSIGAEPLQYGTSFGSIRSEALSEALRSTRNNNGSFADFHANALARLRETGVDPQLPYLNHSTRPGEPAPEPFSSPRPAPAEREPAATPWSRPEPREQPDGHEEAASPSGRPPRGDETPPRPREEEEAHPREEEEGTPRTDNGGRTPPTPPDG